MSRFFILAIVIMFLVTPVFADAALVSCGRNPGPDVPYEETLSCRTCDFFVMIKRIIDFAVLQVIPPVAVLFVAIAGIAYYTSGLNEQWRTTGKNILTSVVIGLVIIYGAWMIVDSVLLSVSSGFTKQPEGFPWPWNQVECPARSSISPSTGQGSGSGSGEGGTIPPSVPLEEISSIALINPTDGMKIDISLNGVGVEKRLSLIATLKNGEKEDITLNLNSTYVSSDSAILTIDGGALIKTIGIGRASVMASVDVGGDTVTDEMGVTVNRGFRDPAAGDDEIISIALAHFITGSEDDIVLEEIGDKARLKLIATLKNGDTENITLNNNVSYVSSDPFVVSVNKSADVEAVGRGDVSITASVGVAGFIVTDEIKVSVPIPDFSLEDIDEIVLVDAETNSEDAVLMKVIGEEKQLKVIAVLENGERINMSFDDEVTYRSRNDFIALVDDNAMVRAQMDGETVVTARIDDIRGSGVFFSDDIDVTVDTNIVADCTKIEGSGSRNIVFVPVNNLTNSFAQDRCENFNPWTDNEIESGEWNQIASSFSSSLKFDPINLSNFSTYYLNNIKDDSSMDVCSSIPISQVAYVIRCSSGPSFADMGNGRLWIRSINNEGRPTALSHELGHSFGSLYDEYVSEKQTIPDTLSVPSNCVQVADASQCPVEWPISGVQCYEGCNLQATGYFRDAFNDLMRNDWEADSYGPVDKYILNLKLGL